MRLADGFKRLAIEAICLTVLGLSRGAALDAVLADYALVLPGFASLPIPLPGTAFTRARQALGRILAVLETSVKEHEAAPRDDGLSRILAAWRLAAQEKSPDTVSVLRKFTVSRDKDTVSISGTLPGATVRALAEKKRAD